MSSLHLFKVAKCGLDIIKNFSEMHKLHRLVRVVYALAFARIFHVIWAWLSKVDGVLHELKETFFKGASTFGLLDYFQKFSEYVIKRYVLVITPPFVD